MNIKGAIGGGSGSLNPVTVLWANFSGTGTNTIREGTLDTSKRVVTA